MTYAVFDNLVQPVLMRAALEVRSQSAVDFVGTG